MHNTLYIEYVNQPKAHDHRKNPTQVVGQTGFTKEKETLEQTRALTCRRMNLVVLNETATY